MIKLTGNVRHDGYNYRTGNIIEKINKKQAQRLVDLGVAFFIAKNEESEEIVRVEQEMLNYEEELDLLDYNDLKVVAKEVGLEFKGNISKKNLITLIIEEDKVEEVLAFTEVEE